MLVSEKQTERFLRRAWKDTDDLMVALQRACQLAKTTGSRSATVAIFRLIDTALATGGLPLPLADMMARRMLRAVLTSIGIKTIERDGRVHAVLRSGETSKNGVGWDRGWYAQRGEWRVEHDDAYDAAHELVYEYTGQW